MASPINSYLDWLADAHVKAVDAYQTLPFAGVGSLPIASIPRLSGIRFRRKRLGARPGRTYVLDSCLARANRC